LRPQVVVADASLRSFSFRFWVRLNSRLRRNWLKGTLGDAIHAVLCGAGHNLRMILRRLRLFYALILVALLGFKSATP
jgi:IS5 family transposase